MDCNGKKIEGSGVGTAVKTDQKRIDAIKDVKSAKKDENHLIILMKTDQKGAIYYQAGYGWEKAGEIKSFNDWKTYLNEK